MVLKIHRLCSIVFISICVGIAILSLILATFLISPTPYPFLICFCVLFAFSVTPVCCYDEQGTTMGDLGWFLTGTFASSAVGGLVLLYRTNEIPEITLYLCIISVVFTFVSCISLYLFFFKQCGNGDAGNTMNIDI